MKPANGHGHHCVSHPGKIIWEGRIITKAPRLVCKCNVTYVIDENSRKFIGFTRKTQIKKIIKLKSQAVKI